MSLFTSRPRGWKRDEGLFLPYRRAHNFSEEARMDLGSINWLAVVVSVIAAMVIGYIWYNPAVFYKPWLAGIGKSWENRPTGPMASLFVFTILAALVEAVALAFVLKAMNATTAGLGA